MLPPMAVAMDLPAFMVRYPATHPVPAPTATCFDRDLLRRRSFRKIFQNLLDRVITFATHLWKGKEALF